MKLTYGARMSLDEFICLLKYFGYQSIAEQLQINPWWTGPHWGYDDQDTDDNDDTPDRFDIEFEDENGYLQPLPQGICYDAAKSIADGFNLKFDDYDFELMALDEANVSVCLIEKNERK